MKAPIYIHLKPEELPPHLESHSPFKAVVVVETDVSPEWQSRISDWLVQSGCRYMLAWGQDCGKWNDSVDWANLQMFDYGDIPEDSFVMTTWHETDSLKETFAFSQQWATHPALELQTTCIIHISQESRATEILAVFRAAEIETE